MDIYLDNTVYGSKIYKKKLKKMKSIIKNKNAYKKINSIDYGINNLFIEKSDFLKDKINFIKRELDNNFDSCNFLWKLSLKFDKKLYKSLKNEFKTLENFEKNKKEIDEQFNRFIIANRIMTPDGTIIESKHTHDFVSHTDANGKTYSVDGGTDYLKRIGDIEDCFELSVFSDDSIFKIRNFFKWGTYGINGDESLKYILLKDMDYNHIVTTLQTQTHLKNYIIDIFKREIEVRDILNTMPKGDI